jgi:hypothetical protein
MGSFHTMNLTGQSNGLASRAMGMCSLHATYSPGSYQKFMLSGLDAQNVCATLDLTLP